VVIALPASLHFRHAVKALRAGKDVCVEKPLALSAGHARELVRIAREEDRVLMVGHLMRYHPAFIALKNLIEGGSLGSIRWIEAIRRDSGEGAPVDASPLWDLAPHDVSMILALTGQVPDDDTAEEARPMGDARLSESPGLALSFPTGIRAFVRVSRTHARKERTFTVITDRARVVFEDTQPWERKLSVYPMPGEPGEAAVGVPEHMILAPAEPLREECRHFLDCVETRKTPLTDGAEGLRVLEALEYASPGVDRGSCWGISGTGVARNPIWDAFVPYAPSSPTGV
jgi:UDP-2-acetamido-3-amino-2,3-dideoxy-glucuronate N-acetyltransferase